MNSAASKYLRLGERLYLYGFENEINALHRGVFSSPVLSLTAHMRYRVRESKVINAIEPVDSTNCLG